MSRKAIVVGAGIVGASVALELARRGWNVRVLERLEGAGQGSTAFSSSVIRCHYTKREAVALALEGQRYWESWSTHTGLSVPRASYRPVGVLFLLQEGRKGAGGAALGMKAEMDEREIHERYRMMVDLGVEVEFLRNADLRNKFPYFRFSEPNLVGLWESLSGYVAYPQGAVQDLREAGEEAGVAYWFQSEVREAETEWVEGWRRIRRVVADTPKETIGLDCDVLVNCAGPDSHALNLDVRCPLPATTAPLRQYIIEGRWENLSETILPAMADLVEGFYIRPDTASFKLGAVLPPDHVDFVRAPDGMADPEEVAQVQARFLERLRRRVPGVELKDVHTQVAYYDWTVSDSYPILDATDVRGYYVAIGTSGAWFKGAPAIGALMAELIERTETGDPSSVVVLPKTGNPIDWKVFSARRS